MEEYKLVPVEPTQEMVDVLFGGDFDLVRDGLPETMRKVYRTMLAAAPSPEWVKTADRLPTRADWDEDNYVWGGEPGKVVLIHHHDTPLYPYWMPKRRQQPPESPSE